MTQYRIVIDKSLCSSFGSCADLAPDIFVLTGAGTATARVRETSDPAVVEAACSCPMGAISVFEVATGEQVA